MENPDIEDPAFKKGYEKARSDMFRELEQLICFYYDNNKPSQGDALIHVRSVLRSMKPGQKPWNPENK